MIKDVHTEHCCATHGCKYGGDDNCTVTTGKAPQSYSCEECDNEDGVMPLFKTEQGEEIDRLQARVAELEYDFDSLLKCYESDSVLNPGCNYGFRQTLNRTPAQSLAAIRAQTLLEVLDKYNSVTTWECLGEWLKCRIEKEANDG